MKKIALALILLLFVVGMVGCGGSEDEGGGDTDAGTNVEKTADEAADKAGEAAKDATKTGDE